MEINVDLSNIPEFEALPTGAYVCQIIKIDVVDSKRTPGNKNLNIEYQVMDEGDFKGRRVFDTLSLSERALWRVRDWVQACGVFPGPQGFKTEELIGCMVRVGLTQEQRMTQNAVTGQLEPVEGKLRNKVAGYSPAA